MVTRLRRARVELLLGVGLPLELHQGLMNAVAPGLKVRVLLAQALFSNLILLLLDEPTIVGHRYDSLARRRAQ